MTEDVSACCGGCDFIRSVYLHSSNGAALAIRRGGMHVMLARNDRVLVHLTMDPAPESEDER